MQQSAARVFGDYIAGLSLDDLPIDVVGKAKDCLLDSIGCLLGAYALPLAGILDGFVKDVASTGTSPILGSDRRTDLATAAFVHATLIIALDFDDIYRKGHPGATVISAALTVAAHIDSSGSELLAAIIAGYEVSGRVGMSLTHLHPAQDNPRARDLASLWSCGRRVEIAKARSYAVCPCDRDCCRQRTRRIRHEDSLWSSADDGEEQFRDSRANGCERSLPRKKWL